MTYFCIVRHGETEWNREKRIQGQADSPLTFEGVTQAGRAARFLAKQRWDAIISSDLGRAMATAQPIADALDLPLQQDPRLRERNFGVFETLLHADIAVRFPVEAAQWQSRDPHFAPPNGESLTQLRARVQAALQDLHARYADGRVVVVSHGVAIDAMYRIAANVDMRVERNWPLVNASLNEITVTANVWRIGEWGKIDHLSDPLDAADEFA
jgi:2,3-bisphosphoglycerate-dependent phosphoglycerate mutase